MLVSRELFFHVSCKFAFTRDVFRRCRFGVSALALASVLFLAGCDSGGGGTPTRGFSSLNIADATALIITRPSGSGSANAATAEGERRLFKITDQGVVVEVDYFDEDDQLVQETAKPVYVYDLNDQFFFFQFGFGNELLGARISYPQYEFEEAVLVRKSDGAVFDSPWGTAFLFEVETDAVIMFGKARGNVADDNLYYTSEKIDDQGQFSFDTIRRVDVSNPDQLLDSQVSPDLHNIFPPFGDRYEPPFFVDASGNVFYVGNNVVSGLDVGRVIMPDGTAIAFTGFTPFSIGLDGAVYGFDFSGVSGDLLRANIDAAGNFATSFYANLPSGPLGFGGWRVSLPGKIIFFDFDGTAIEVFNAAGVPVEITSLNGLFSQVVSVVESPNYIYMFGVASAGGTIILRMDPGTPYAVLQIVGSALYEIFRFTVTNNDEVIFDGIRISDSARVQAIVDQSLTLTIISESSGAQEPVIVERLQ